MITKMARRLFDVAEKGYSTHHPVPGANVTLEIWQRQNNQLSKLDLNLLFGDFRIRYVPIDPI